MRLWFRSKHNRHRNWLDRLGEVLVGSRRRPLTPTEVVHRGLVVAALMMPLVVWNHGQKVVHQAKKLQARFEARQAEQLRLSGRADEALCSLMNSCKRTPDEIEVIRGIAWAAAPAFPLQAKHFLQKLTDAEAATPEDLMLMASVMLTLEQPAEAAKIYEALVRAQPRNPDVWRAWAAACHRRGELSEAMKAYRRVLSLAPHDLQASVGMAELLLRPGTDQDARAATAILLAQFERSVGSRIATSRDLADLLVGVPVTDEGQRRRLGALLRAMPDPKPGHVITGIMLSYPVAPSKEEGKHRREEIRSFLALHREIDFEDRKTVSLVLQKHGENALALDWISLADAAGDPVMFAQRLDALMSCGLWKEAGELASHPAAREFAARQPWLNSLAVLRNCREPKAMAENMLAQSLKDAQDREHHTACNAIGYAALDYGIYPLAARAFATAIEKGNGTASPLKEYLHAARRSGRPADDVMKVLDVRARTERADQTLLEQSIYLRLLCGCEVERAALDLEEIKKRGGEEAYLKFLNAFMRYRHGDYAGAVKALLPLPAHRWHQGETVVISTILAAGGQMRQAARLAGEITGEGVFPEEKRLLDSWQSRAQLDSTLLGSVTVFR